MDLNEEKGTVRVFYAEDGSVFFRESPLSAIAFGAKQTLMSGGLNNPTSAKDRWTGRLVVLASNTTDGTAIGTLITTDPGLVGRSWRMPLNG